MKKNEMVKSGLQAITVMFQFEDLGEQIELRYPGFLTNANHAMFVENVTLMMVPVQPTNEPNVYLAGYTFELGIVHDLSQSALIIESAAKKLRSMNAYEFVTEILMNCTSDIDFEDLIVPVPAKSDFFKPTLESGVA